MKKYDIAAYVWPAYTGDEPGAKIFWDEGIGEWQTVKSAMPKFPGHQWPRKPLWGYQNEADPMVMQMQIETAVSHGVNVFIYDWYWYDKRPFLEKCLNEGFLKAPNTNKMSFYLMWANHDASVLWDKRNADNYQHPDSIIWSGAQDAKEFEVITDRIIEKYFKRDNYYMIDGKPVFAIYDLDNLIKGLGGFTATLEAFEGFRDRTVKAGFAGLHLQMIISTDDTTGPCKYDANLKGKFKGAAEYLKFDSMTNYQFSSMCWVPDAPEIVDYLDKLKEVEGEWERIDKEYSITYYPHVSVGWDANPRFIKWRRKPVYVNNTPENVEKAFRAAKAYLEKHPEITPLITVNSWNEWTESSYLLPDDLYGYGYLEAIKRVFVEDDNK